MYNIAGSPICGLAKKWRCAMCNVQCAWPRLLIFNICGLFSVFLFPVILLASPLPSTLNPQGGSGEDPD